jgi:hypothetical protein
MMAQVATDAEHKQKHDYLHHGVCVHDEAIERVVYGGREFH